MTDAQVTDAQVTEDLDALREAGDYASLHTTMFGGEIHDIASTQIMNGIKQLARNPLAHLSDTTPDPSDLLTAAAYLRFRESRNTITELHLSP